MNEQTLTLLWERPQISLAHATITSVLPVTLSPSEDHVVQSQVSSCYVGTAETSDFLSFRKVSEWHT